MYVCIFVHTHTLSLSLTHTHTEPLWAVMTRNAAIQKDRAQVADGG